MAVELRNLTELDIPAHCAGEDEATVRWLTGGYGTAESTRAHFELLARNAAAGRGKRGFGVWLDGRLAGYVDCDPDNLDGLGEDDVNISYATHPWARRRGVATRAVELIREYIRANKIGAAAVIRVEPDNQASIRVAQKAGFRFDREVASSTDFDPEGNAKILRRYHRQLA